MRGKIIAYLQTASSSSSKKYKVTIVYPDGKRKTVNFGAKGYSDYTKHHDPERKKKYITRHKSRENWTKSGIESPGFWSRWILWSEPSLSSAISYTSKKFNITIKRGVPPKGSGKKKSKSYKKSRKSVRKSH